MEISVHRPSPPNTYSYVRDKNSGSTRKFIQNYLLFTFISNHTRCAWAGGTFLRCLRKVPQAHSRSALVLQELGWKYT